MKYIYRILIFALISLLLFGYYYSDRFLPHTFINGIDVGGETYAEAREKIVTVFEDIKTKGFDLEFIRGNVSRVINIPAAATGFTSDTVVEYFSIGNTEEAINEAYGWSRESSIFLRWHRRILSIFSDKFFEISYSIQKEAVFSLLERELNGFLGAPQNAEFIEKNGKIMISEGKFGADIDFEKVVKEMDDRLFYGGAENLRFNVNLMAPPITAEDLRSKLDFIDVFAGLVDLKFWNGPYWWRVRGPILSNWLALNKDNKELIEIRPDKLRNFVQMNIDMPIEGKMINSRFEMRNGELIEIIPGRAGLEINFDKLKTDIEKEVQRIYLDHLAGKLKTETLAIKFTIEKVLPKITKESIERHNIVDLIGRAKTSFAGSSSARINNIKIGVSRLNGILIAPGEEFSAVRAIGEVNEEGGYQKEFVIKVDKSVEEFGGGLCQIATTLFRLALDSGLLITERQNHSYVVGYYGPGLDATIYGPYPDLKFVNDTENYILLQGMVEGNDLIFEFYGRKDGRKITISEPRIRDKISPPDTKYILTSDLPLAEKKCTEKRRDGLTAEVDYLVEYADSSVRTQTFVSEYKPWQEVCFLGMRF